VKLKIKEFHPSIPFLSLSLSLSLFLSLILLFSLSSSCYRFSCLFLNSPSNEFSSWYSSSRIFFSNVILSQIVHWPIFNRIQMGFLVIIISSVSCFVLSFLPENISKKNEMAKGRKCAFYTNQEVDWQTYRDVERWKNGANLGAYRFEARIEMLWMFVLYGKKQQPFCMF